MMSPFLLLGDASLVRLGEIVMILELHRQGVSVSAIARRGAATPYAPCADAWGRPDRPEHGPVRWNMRKLEVAPCKTLQISATMTADANRQLAESRTGCGSAAVSRRGHRLLQRTPVVQTRGSSYEAQPCWH